MRPEIHTVKKQPSTANDASWTWWLYVEHTNMKNRSIMIHKTQDQVNQNFNSKPDTLNLTEKKNWGTAVSTSAQKISSWTEHW